IPHPPGNPVALAIASPPPRRNTASSMPANTTSGTAGARTTSSNRPAASTETETRRGDIGALAVPWHPRMRRAWGLKRPATGARSGRRRSAAVNRQRLPVQEPEQQRQHHRDDECRGDRDIEPEVFALDDDVAGQPAQPDARQPWPQQADDDEDEAGDDQESHHVHLNHP